MRRASGAPEGILIGLLLTVITLPSSDLSAQAVRIVQTNSGADTLQLIEPENHSVVGEIFGTPNNVGVVAHPAGKRFYVSDQGRQTMDVIDGGRLRVMAEVPLSGRPENIAISPDGQRLFVAIATEPGAIDIIDTETYEHWTLFTAGGMYEVVVTPDGQHVIAGSVGGRHMVVVDAEAPGQQWRLFEEAVLAVAVETHADGSTHRLFVQLEGVHGFAVVDFEERRVSERLRLPGSAPSDFADDPRPLAHGIGVAPDGETLWVNSTRTDRVHVYALPGLEYLDEVETAAGPTWLAFTPDSRYVYVTCTSADVVSVIDVQSRERVTDIAVGPAPRRSVSAVLPERD